MMKKKLLFLLIFIGMNIQMGHSQTYVSGGIFSNTTWTLSNSPYIVTDTLTLFPNITLTIQPGVMVKFNDNVFFDVRGTLVAIGTAPDSIIFTSSSSFPVQGIWSGIFISTWLGGNVNFNYCQFHYAYIATQIGYAESGGPINIKNSLYKDNTTCILGYTGWTITMESLNFENNINAIGDGGSSVGGFNIYNSNFINNNIAINYINFITFYNSIFCGNNNAMFSGLSINFQNCKLINNHIAINEGLSVGLDNCIIALNDTGIVLVDIPYYINQCNICSNNSYGLINKTTSNIDLSNNCWCESDSADISYYIYDGHDNVAFGLVDFTPYIICDSTVLPDTSYCTQLPMAVNNQVKYEDNKIAIFPNPCSSKTTLHTLTNLSNATLFIDNCFGKTVKQVKNISGQTVTLWRENLPSGLYFIRLTEGNKIIGTKKLLITD